MRALERPSSLGSGLVLLLEGHHAHAPGMLRWKRRKQSTLHLLAERRGVCGIAGFVPRLLAAANNGDRQKR
jgi:hypothetical protein